MSKYEKGYVDGYERGRIDGYNLARDEFYDEGFEAGYHEGLTDGGGQPECEAETGYFSGLTEAEEATAQRSIMEGLMGFGVVCIEIK